MGKPDLDVAPRQCAGSCVAPHAQLFGKTSDIRCAPSTLFSGLSPRRLSPVSQTQIILKGRHFQTIEEIQKMRQENCAPSQKVRSRKHSKDGRNVENGVSPVERTAVKGTVLKLL